MAEILSPDPGTTGKQRAPMATRLQSPTSPFFLGSNDDQLERAQARAARAAAIRRKTTAVAAANPPSASPCLGSDQILELFQNCIKLASENKINQKNTWELKLIDHLSEIIIVSAEEDTDTNFQKASCTLEAGVKIYSLRVDSVHSEAYKVLGGINRVGREEESETIEGEGDNIGSGQEEGGPKKETGKKISPLSTLESSFEALNVKKFDVAFAVDPLYHQTTAKFDEGGAKGLLLNNLGVYGGCRVLFDSFEVPGRCISNSTHNDASDVIDISFAKDHFEQMVMNMAKKNEISPSLRDIVCLLDEDNQRSSHAIDIDPTPARNSDVFGDNNFEFDGNSFEHSESWTYDHDHQHGDDADLIVADQSSNFMDQPFDGLPEENEPFMSNELDTSDRFNKVAGFLFQGLGFSYKHNSWAGPDHWKYYKSKVSEDAPATEGESVLTHKKTKNKKIVQIDIDFTNSLDKEVADIFAPPKNPKSLLLPANRTPGNNTLPEDCHYQPEDLVKLFLLPKVMCFGKRRRKASDGQSWQNNDFDDQFPSWDNASVVGGQCDDGFVHSDVEDMDTLVSQPRQVNKIQVHYDKVSKQVDVCQDTISISFKQVLATFPDDCQAAAVEDISPHLCFICLLHLANEHNLTIHDCPTLDDLSISFLSSSQNKGRVQL
ncbi:Condensin complex subunit 2/barren [Dillenia turbinata]|uniref:Condensin complex subunit 2 n=1 Tax=Dillenia turbinata TaxID=194707 RepID=A0AAN8WBZ2_9MAGN